MLKGQAMSNPKESPSFEGGGGLEGGRQDRQTVLRADSPIGDGFELVSGGESQEPEEKETEQSNGSGIPEQMRELKSYFDSKLAGLENTIKAKDQTISVLQEQLNKQSATQPQPPREESKPQSIFKQRFGAALDQVPEDKRLNSQEKNLLLAQIEDELDELIEERVGKRLAQIEQKLPNLTKPLETGLEEMNKRSSKAVFDSAIAEITEEFPELKDEGLMQKFMSIVGTDVRAAVALRSGDKQALVDAMYTDFHHRSLKQLVDQLRKDAEEAKRQEESQRFIGRPGSGTKGRPKVARSGAEAMMQAFASLQA